MRCTQAQNLLTDNKVQEL